MNLTDKDIREILLSDISPELKAGQDYYKKMRMFFTGEGIKDYLDKIETFEDDRKRDIRQKYASTLVDVFARLQRPEDKVWNARGGSAYYDMSDSDKSRLLELLSNVEYGYTLKEWMRTFWRKAYNIDPMSLIFHEMDGNGDPYPTYKCSTGIYRYKLNGRYVEWVAFNADNLPEAMEHRKTRRKDTKGTYYRVVDDSFDKLVKWDGKTLQTIDTYPNYWGKVPAVITSDKYDPMKGMFISPYDDVMHLADQLLLDCSVYNIVKKLYGFPRFWAYAGACKSCKGTKYIGDKACSSCNGSGLHVSRDPSEQITLTYPTKDDQKLAPDIAGYIIPPVEVLKAMRDEKEWLMMSMEFTQWGTNSRERAENDTATGEFIDIQAVNDRREDFSKAGERMEKDCTSFIASVKFKSFKSSSHNWGRRYLAENPDAVWKKYQDARAGAPDTSLDELLAEYYEAKYANDQNRMDWALKLLQVEPYPHLTLQQAKTLIAPEDYLKKMYYREWVSQYTMTQILVKPTRTLRDELATYVSGKGNVLEQMQEQTDKEKVAA